jgi:hypothetical protein
MVRRTRALPRIESRLAGSRHRPEAPDFLAGFLIVRRDEPVGAMLAAADAGDHQVSGEERRGRGEVILLHVRERSIPDERAGPLVEREHARVVGLEEQAVAGNRDAAIRPGRRARRARALEVPDLASAAGVERVDFVDGRHVHDPVDDDGRDLQGAGVGQREQPARHEARDVGLFDLRERRIAVAARIAVVRGPRRFGRHLADGLCRTSQETHAAVGRPDLQVVGALAEHRAFDRASVGGAERARRCDGLGLALDGAQEADERSELVVRHRVRRHAAQRNAVADERPQLRVVAHLEFLEDRGPHFGTGPVGAVAASAAGLEGAAAGAVLRERGRGQDSQTHDKRGPEHSHKNTVGIRRRSRMTAGRCRSAPQPFD